MSELIISEINPSILLTEKISGASGRLYFRRNIETTDSEGRKTQHWEVTLVTDTSPELRELQRLKLLAYSRIRRVCTQTPVGLICPETRKEVLNSTILELRDKVRQFNSSAQSSSLSLRYSLFSIPVDSKTVIAALCEQMANIVDTILSYLQAPAIVILGVAQKNLLAGLTPEQILLREDKDRVAARALAHLIRHELLSIYGMEDILSGEASALASKFVQEAKEAASKVVRGTGKGESLESIIGGLDLASLDEMEKLFSDASNKADEESGYGSLKVVEPPPVVEEIIAAPVIPSLLDMPFEELEEEIEEPMDWDDIALSQIFNFGD